MLFFPIPFLGFTVFLLSMRYLIVIVSFVVDDTERATMFNNADQPDL